MNRRAHILFWSAPLLTLLVAERAPAQKIDTQYDKSARFASYKRYAWDKNYLLTHQRPEDQSRIDSVLVASINRELQSKGFVLDEKNPDFRVKYEAGAVVDAKTSAAPDLVNGGTPGPSWSSNSLGGTDLDVWTSTVSRMRIMVADAASGKVVWQTQLSQKLHDPQKFMNDLDKNVDKTVDKAMKKFPPVGAKS